MNTNEKIEVKPWLRLKETVVSPGAWIIFDKAFNHLVGGMRDYDNHIYIYIPSNQIWNNLTTLIEKYPGT